MKTLIIGLITFFSTSLVLAQTESGKEIKPVSFMGIRVAGNLNDFLPKMVEKGFKVSDDGTANMSVLKGSFLGEDAQILVLSTEGTEQVYGVIVLLGQNNNWNAMKSNFNTLKKSLSEEYGKPKVNDHYFAKPFDDVQDEMQKVELGMCDYICSWNNPNVVLEITKNARIIITYENEASFNQYAGL
jgi:hypothetical protein